MSILNPVNQPVTQTANMVAGQMKAQARGLYNMLVKTFNDGAKNFWTNANFTPQQLANALGTDGKELFELHAKIGQLLASVNPEAIAEGLSVVGQFSYTEDGKILLPTTTTVKPTTAPQA
jgi:hypothetical protein